MTQTLLTDQMAEDLEAFAKHRKGAKAMEKGGKVIINVDDVRMLDRRHVEMVHELHPPLGPLCVTST